jgi:hypothetical protein
LQDYSIYDKINGKDMAVTKPMPDFTARFERKAAAGVA